jgi:acyl CoA:acetate/3-ketoacid CoA transferase
VSLKLIETSPTPNSVCPHKLVVKRKIMLVNSNFILNLGITFPRLLPLAIAKENLSRQDKKNT